ncbi:hypothetical protein AJ85_18215 [Alkalihalobacillus alcalophilus ATCC 27647 = CGMCC 1.3604]|uniref:Uncharacterized protein n=1 Tax=Alkalihalobacillus alcalophilus ATCC 27647 = CGMCC 1.3604 TaxID=1218173 RepID=A0A094YSX4_ALKAL|nr:hypothetical protein BALCAV_0215285 [Alkalihalobacillus alcalophilus ATCC 27647 = CGMCC 1.3604]THG89342.1 hypothetical protein AJ85_18215 [Alkalihalobacillus alcalophilus ATCC 27647 = CGMCC 1.3604]
MDYIYGQAILFYEYDFLRRLQQFDFQALHQHNQYQHYIISLQLFLKMADGYYSLDLHEELLSYPSIYSFQVSTNRLCKMYLMWVGKYLKGHKNIYLFL